MRRRAIIQMVLIGVLSGIGVALLAYFIPWLPDRASEEATQIDRVFWFVTFICIAIFAIVAAVSIYAGLKFRAPPDDPDDGAPIHGHTGLEIIWTAIPTVLVTAIAIYSGLVLIDIEDIPDDHVDVEVISQQFAWSFRYPEHDITSGELVLEVGKPVELTLSSKDVIHSFWVPEFRIKQDAVPGIETRAVVTPNQPGTFPIRCTELCGLGHAVMLAHARVLSSEKFEEWVQKQKGGDGGEGEGDVEATSGDQIFEEAGCAECHTLAAAGSTAEIGPNLDNVLRDRDADYIRESIVSPNAKIAEGFNPNQMPQDFEERLSDEQIDALVRFLMESVAS